MNKEIKVDAETVFSFFFIRNCNKLLRLIESKNAMNIFRFSTNMYIYCVY